MPFFGARPVLVGEDEFEQRRFAPGDAVECGFAEEGIAALGVENFQRDLRRARVGDGREGDEHLHLHAGIFVAAEGDDGREELFVGDRAEQRLGEAHSGGAHAGMRAGEGGGDAGVAVGFDFIGRCGLLGIE